MQMAFLTILQDSLTEPLLAKALSLITGVSASSRARISPLETMPLNEIDHSKNHTILKERMYLDKDISLEIK